MPSNLTLTPGQTPEVRKETQIEDFVSVLEQNLA